jgi:hypothetical protein
MLLFNFVWVYYFSNHISNHFVLVKVIYHDSGKLIGIAWIDRKNIQNTLLASRWQIMPSLNVGIFMRLIKN